MLLVVTPLVIILVAEDVRLLVRQVALLDVLTLALMAVVLPAQDNALVHALVQ